MDNNYSIAAHSRQRATLGAVVLALAMLAVISGTAVGAQTTYPPNTVVSTYVDLRYCGGPIAIVTDASGVLINVCTATGQRIYPVFADNGFAAGYAGIGSTLPGFVPPAVNTQYPYPYANGAYPNGAYLNNAGCGFNGANCGALPAGGTQVGNVIYYTDNRYCGDGQVALVLGQGYFCQNGAPFVQNG